MVFHWFIIRRSTEGGVGGKEFFVAALKDVKLRVVEPREGADEAIPVAESVAQGWGTNLGEFAMKNKDRGEQNERIFGKIGSDLLPGVMIDALMDMPSFIFKGETTIDDGKVFY